MSDPVFEEAPPRPLHDDLVALIRDQLGSNDHDVSDWEKGFASAIMQLLNERGHYLPGCPPAEQILADARQFAEEVVLSKLTVRLLRMGRASGIMTPETKGMERWLNDYIDGRHHGPLGKPMLWPSGLKGLAGQLREWGFEPTATRPPFVARAATRQFAVPGVPPATPA